MKLYELQAQSEVHALESKLDALMAELDIDVSFSRHFVERLLGREQQVSQEEIVASFDKLKSKYKNKLEVAKGKGNYKALLKDLDQELNIAFALRPPRHENELADLKNITIMRKRDFRTDNEPGSEVLSVGLGPRKMANVRRRRY